MLKYIIIALAIIPFLVNAQDEICLPKDKKAKKLFFQAMEELHMKNYEYVRLYLLDAIQRDPDNAAAPYYEMAKLERREADRTRDKPTNEYTVFNNRYKKYITQTVALCPDYYEGKPEFELAEDLYDDRDYRKAIPFYEHFIKNDKADKLFKKNAARHLQVCKTYVKLMDNPVPFEPKVVTGVSTVDKEYLPNLSPDGENFYYIRGYPRKCKDCPPGSSGNIVEEFYYSKSIAKDNTSFDGGSKMPPPFNMDKEGNQGGISLSIDNKHMYITMSDLELINGHKYLNFDLYSSDYIDGKWTPLKNMGNKVNKNDQWDSQPTISADGRTLYFTSTREGGIGGLDIWKTIRDDKGVWGEPINLGEPINTVYDEKTPFMHSDSKTLYFSSNRDGGVGGFDIYLAKMIDDKTWEEPVNIGYPINSEDDDLGFFASTDGHTGYFCSDKLHGKGSWDIYAFDLYEEARPKKVLFLKGQVKDENGEGVKGATVELKNSTTKQVNKAMIDSVTGEYAIAVVVDEKKVVKLPKTIAPKTEAIIATTLPKTTELTATEQQKTTIPTTAKKDSAKTIITPDELIRIQKVKSDSIKAFADKQAALALAKLKKDTKKTPDLVKTKQASTQKIDTVLLAVKHEDDSEILNAKEIAAQTNTLPGTTIAKPNLSIKDKPELVKEEDEEPATKDDEFVLTVKKQGFAYSAQLIKPTENGFDRPATVDVKMETIAVGKSYQLNNINFPTNSADLNKESFGILDDFISYLKENSSLKIGIYGFTDNMGTERSNLMLSERRAKTVQDYLIQQGIEAARLSYKGFGQANPVASNATEEGKAKNRRTEFMILGK